VRIHELDGESQAAAQSIQAREQELAALRYAILDSARVGNKIKHERREMDCNTAEGWKRMLATLLHNATVRGAARVW
jgi:hypothetical protein